MDKETLLRKSIALQHDHKDCGSACLLTAIQWYGYQDSLEHLRTLTGTNTEGVTLLGLQQAANQIGFEAEAFRASIQDLSTTSDLIILHVVKHDRFNHFVLCLGKENEKWLIADPEDGVKKYSDDQLLNEWKEGTLLRLKYSTELNLPKHDTSVLKDWFLPLFTLHKKRLAQILSLGIIHSVLLFSTSVFTEKLVDELLPTEDKSLILGGILLWSVFLLLSLGLSYMRSHTIALFSRDFNSDLVNRFFGKLLYLPKPFFDSKKTGDLVTRLEDVEGIEESATKWVEDGLIGFLVVLVALGLLFVYSVQLALITLFLLPMLFGVILMLRKKVNTSQREAMVSHALNNANYVDAITGVDIIKARQAELKFSKYALKLYKAFRNKVFLAEKVNMNFDGVVQFLVLVITIAVVGVSSMKVLAGDMQMGNFLAIISISSIASINTTNLAFAYIDFEQAKISFDRMHDLVGQRTEGLNDEKPLLIRSKNVLSIENLSFSFPGQPALLNDVSLTLEEGRLVTLLGDSGGGKSTLINLISTLYHPDAGVISFNDQNVHQSPLNWRRLIGVVPQETKVFNATFWENVSVKSIGEENEMARARVEQLIDIHHLSAFVQGFHDGVDTVLGENGVRLSGGQKKILGLIRALYNHPKALLLDEVTASLDRKNQALVREILQKLKQRIPILQITHDAIVATHSDYIYMLSDGKIKIQGTPQALIEEGGLFNDFLRSA